MRELTEAEKITMDNAFNDANPANTKRGFVAGFTAGLESQDARIAELEARIAELEATLKLMELEVD
jgi:hypothetical protein